MNKEIPPVFMPDNEPYLGRVSVHHFDEVILSCMELNAKVAALTHKIKMNELQLAACEIVPSGISIALSIRELVRQGYLFSAFVLMRPLIERVGIISYLCVYPAKIDLWKNGWKHKTRPTLAQMLATMASEVDTKKSQEICSLYNHVVHGDPVGATYNLMKKEGKYIGYSAGKNLDDPDFCDLICFQTYCYLIVLMARLSQVFPDSSNV